MKCICHDWKTNIAYISAPIHLQVVRSGIAWPGKPFSHCPWCGSELTLEVGDYGSAKHPKALIEGGDAK